MKERVQLTKSEIIMGFVVSCIEDVADTLGVDYLEVYRRMDAVKMIDEYIVPYLSSQANWIKYVR